MASLQDRISAASMPNLTDNRFRNSGAGMGGEAGAAYTEQQGNRLGQAEQDGMQGAYLSALDARRGVADQTRATNQGVGLQAEHLDQARQAARFQVDNYKMQKQRQLQQIEIQLAQMRARMSDTLDKYRSDTTASSGVEAWNGMLKGGATFATMGLERFAPEIDDAVGSAFRHVRNATAGNVASFDQLSPGTPQEIAEANARRAAMEGMVERGGAGRGAQRAAIRDQLARGMKPLSMATPDISEWNRARASSFLNGWMRNAQEGPRFDFSTFEGG